jgi:uroporphyrin-III C-methyltransferase
MKVYLIGAGPGDPELITVKGRRILQQADAILFDHLAPDALLDLAPPHAERLYVGKKKSAHAFTQEEISAMLIERARRGLTVVRLKGGDPFLFGRGGEEALALVEAGIAFEVVPGVSSLAAVPATAGIPVTHRGVSSQVTIVNGHGPLDFAALAATPGTLVVFMGLGRLDELAAGLIEHGRVASTPAAVIANGTLPAQRTVVAPLAQIADAAGDLEPPALVVVGDVVALAATLDALVSVAA